MMNNVLTLDKDFDISASNSIKGFAIIIMLIHHCFGFPEWYIEGVRLQIDIIVSQYIASGTKICISLFAFVTGWAYFYNKDKSYNYSLKKIMKFLFQYWIILFFIFYPIAILANTREINFEIILLNLLALDNNIVFFAWYVYFYVLVMLTMPIICRVMDTEKWMIKFIPIIISYIVSVICYIFIRSNSFIINDLIEYVYWLPCIIIGYLLPQSKIYKNLYQYVKKFNVIWLLNGIFCIIIIRSFRSGIIGINLDIIYAPIMCLFIISIIQKFNNKIREFFCFLGKHSMNIWLLHSIFYSPYTAKLTQGSIYWSNNIILSFFMLLFLSLCSSIIFTKIKENIGNRISNIVSQNS